jgi:hypothetical protein
VSHVVVLVEDDEQGFTGLPPNRLGVPREKRSKKSKKGGKMRNLHVGLEDGNEMKKCYQLSFYSYLQLKKIKICALTRAIFQKHNSRRSFCVIISENSTF